MVLLQLTFLIVVLIASYFVIAKKMKADLLSRYLLFVLINSFFFFKIFHEQSALWVTLICAIGLVLNTKLLIIKKVVLILVTGIVVSVYRVPFSSAEFDDYVKGAYGIECVGSECVKVKKVVREDTMKLQTNEYSIQGYSFHWYYVFSRGELTLNDKSIKAINVMGFWFPLTESMEFGMARRTTVNGK
ncbi:hypothetical protein DVB69_09760 [Sporosarcina sp. BI001-red]|uniref:hypothetical protein n=1 Tax=Sporosarcina sp. BI001-red TaxID=2282866 RepID=UPI000E25177A|nr:hypothetical protein [Sporosarcina sp. BI001-red]REB07132.1 hypothetical protein DVB69_09760 [Sporosarcina sp. BI001-red]